MRSTRATELVEIYPNHIVNEWMGHTEAVAHYRQTTGKAIEKFYEQAAGTGKKPPQKNAGKTVREHAETGCSMVEAAENFPTNIPIIQGFATKYPTIQGLGENPH